MIEYLGDIKIFGRTRGEAMLYEREGDKDENWTEMKRVLGKDI